MPVFESALDFFNSTAQTNMCKTGKRLDLSCFWNLTAMQWVSCNLFFSCNLSQNSNMYLKYWTSQTAIAVCCQSQHGALLWNSKALSRFWVEGNENILLAPARKTQVCYKQLSFMSECCWRMKPLSDPSAEHSVAMLTLMLLTMHCLHWSVILTGYMSESQGSKLQGLEGKTWYLVLVIMVSAHLLVTGAVHLWSM